MCNLSDYLEFALHLEFILKVSSYFLLWNTSKCSQKKAQKPDENK